MAKEPSWKQQRDRDELAARKQQQEAKSDPVLEQCVVAYVNWVKDFGPQPWDAFRRDWLMKHGAMLEMQAKAKAEAEAKASQGSEAKDGSVL